MWLCGGTRVCVERRGEEGVPLQPFKLKGVDEEKIVLRVKRGGRRRWR
jgi:hypothetical protein